MDKPVKDVAATDTDWKKNNASQTVIKLMIRQGMDKQLRVAIVVIELRPGGMERLVVHLAKGLSRQGIPVMVICLQNPVNWHWN